LTNIGIEASFYDRIRTEITWYNRKTKDMLMEVPVPYTSGFSTIMQNIGSMKNTGVELSLGVLSFSLDNAVSEEMSSLKAQIAKLTADVEKLKGSLPA
jgi:hypothetical protein